MPILPIDFTDGANTVFLTNLQANILKHHGRRYAWHIFITFNIDPAHPDSNKAGAIAQWISSYTTEHLVSALKQLRDVEEHRKARAENRRHDAGPVVCMFLSAAGYEALGLKAYMPGAKLEAQEQAFHQGLQQRGPVQLKDPVLSEWETGYQQPLHAMLLLADESEDILQGLLQAISIEAVEVTYAREDKKYAIRDTPVANIDKGPLFRILHVQEGQELKHNGIGIEHFGYADGVSQPTYLKGEVKAGRAWDDNEKNLAELIVEEHVKDEKDCYGSYLVFRKLEQNVKAFKEREEEIGQKLFPHLAAGEEDKAEIAGAYIVGRFEDGTPVTKFDAGQTKETSSPDTELEGATEKKQHDNDFNYKHDKSGARCPFHAHIRMTNPRDRNLPEFTRISRRGITYDEAGRNGNMDWFPEGGVGLLFMCYQGSIEKQFEVIQGKWANDGDIHKGQPTGIDGVIGQGDNKYPQLYPHVYNSGDHLQLKAPFAGFVTMKGGEYFYAPSIPFLKGIHLLDRTF